MCQNIATAQYETPPIMLKGRGFCRTLLVFFLSLHALHRTISHCDEFCAAFIAFPVRVEATQASGPVRIPKSSTSFARSPIARAAIPATRRAVCSAETASPRIRRARVVLFESIVCRVCASWSLLRSCFDSQCPRVAFGLAHRPLSARTRSCSPSTMLTDELSHLRIWQCECL